jgi:hypothetical protein
MTDGLIFVLAVFNLQLCYQSSEFIYLFICNLFNNVVSSSDYIASNYGMISEKLIAFVHFIVIEKLIVYFEVSIKDLY